MWQGLKTPVIRKFLTDPANQANETRLQQTAQDQRKEQNEM
jgi:hypothetical protein